jgi:hypothetical protein
LPLRIHPGPLCPRSWRGGCLHHRLVGVIA